MLFDSCRKLSLEMQNVYAHFLEFVNESYVLQTFPTKITFFVSAHAHN